ncbi:Hypoxanthine-guanine phosphoribosyltransferase isoform 2 [Hibiscus syriacus]|uniref:Hypoxanthine-guanine phosphoribosyltransferase isoform 2 n=1 Tax=Hibiscus syriacus TaxID=106335 RepID=A0A6A3AR44_HIBSY|nr:Hypoxanthine-guanine phosphoribosyltransferase isoform 2 [Hibiscus syriacus]
MSLYSHIEEVLWTQYQILDRVTQVASQITRDFNSVHDPPLFVGVATGALFFFSDLIRRIQLPLSVDLVRAQSYSSDTLCNGAPSISLDLKLTLRANTSFW